MKVFETPIMEIQKFIVENIMEDSTVFDNETDGDILSEGLYGSEN